MTSARSFIKFVKKLPEKVEKSIQDAKWKKTKVKVGEEIEMEVSLTNQYNGASVYFKIWEDGADVQKDKPLKRIQGFNKDGKATAKWKYIYVHDEDNPLTRKPKFFFTAQSLNCGMAQSGSIEIYDEIDVIAEDNIMGILKNKEYTIFLKSNGEKISGKTDSTGKIIESDLIPGEYNIAFIDNDTETDDDSKFGLEDDYKFLPEEGEG